MPTPVLLCRTALPLSLALTCLISGQAQTGIGSVKTEGAEVAGNVTVRDGRAAIGSNAAVTAGTQTAEVSLTRGGSVKVCAGSSMHVAMTTMANGIQVKRPPVMLSLDRGSIEIHTDAEKTDAILTPDLRFELSGSAPLDLRIRVVPNGDTCVENAGKDAPVLHVTETFGGNAYFIRPGQRVLFEHGSLREVVDHETSNCGCPKDGGLVLAGKGAKGNGKIPEAARTNPFPEAVSQGLAAPAPPQATTPTGEEHVQVSSTLGYSGTTNTVVGPPGQVTTASDVAAASSTATANGTSTGATSTPTAAAQPAATATTTAGTNAHIEHAAPPPA